MNRNIITAEDVTHYRAAVLGASPAPATLADQPPAAGGTSTGDGYLTRLLKYVPPEVIGFYVFVVGVVRAGAAGPQLPYLLLGALVVTALVGVTWSVRVLHVRRARQVVVGVVALLVYDLAVGGWSATQGWFQPWFGSVALALFVVAVAALPVPALPGEPAPTEPGGAAEPAPQASTPQASTSNAPAPRPSAG